MSCMNLTYKMTVDFPLVTMSVNPLTLLLPGGMYSFS